jgi:hypothetical protein
VEISGDKQPEERKCPNNLEVCCKIQDTIETTTKTSKIS